MIPFSLETSQQQRTSANGERRFSSMTAIVGVVEVFAFVVVVVGVAVVAGCDIEVVVEWLVVFAVFVVVGIGGIVVVVGVAVASVALCQNLEYLELDSGSTQRKLTSHIFLLKHTLDLFICWCVFAASTNSPHFIGLCFSFCICIRCPNNNK